MLYEHKIYTVKSSDVERYLEFLVKLFAMLEKHGYKSIGPFRTVIGDKHDIYYLNAWESMAQREKARVAALNDKGVQKLMAPQYVADVIKKTSVLLQDV